MADSDTDSETEERKHLNASGVDNFRDLLKGNIDIIEYLNSESASIGASDATLEEESRLQEKMDTNGLNIHVQSHLLPLLHPGGVHSNGRPLSSSHVAFRTQARLPSYEHAVRLPDSPPETDSGAGSAGSPSGSEASPYSPEFQFHHPGQMQGSVIHPPVAGNVPAGASHSQQPGVILNVHGLDNLTQAIVNDYILPVQTNSRVTNGHSQINAHMPTAAGDFYPNQSVSAAPQNSPSGNYSPYILPPPVHNSFQSDNNLSRKRPRTENSQFVKPEPTSPPIVHGGDDMYFEDGMSHQSIRFFEFQKDQWNTLCDLNGRELKPLGFHVVADKGFNYSHFDGAFVNQKKNHFQVSVHIEVFDRAAPKFVKINGEGGVLRPISEFQLDFYGVKAEMLNSTVLIKQSQTDRKPITYEAVKLDLPPSKMTKVTVARLHFSETTMNNQRKNGRSNPDQKYFYLVAALNAVVQNNERYTVVAYSSEKVIVRASNPGQFDNGDGEVHWQKGQNNSIYHPGPVGIGTDKPTSSLAVAGDIHCTGTLFHPSDAKLKQNISEVNYADAMSKLSQIRIVRYEIKPEIAEQWGLSEEERNRIGVIAQEVEEIIPDAVRDDGEYLTVDDNRIFYESAAAVKELCRLTGNLEYKIDEVEKISKKLSKLSKLKRLDSVKSNASSTFSLSKAGSICTSYLSCSSVGAVSPSKRKDKKDTNNNAGYADNYDDRPKTRHHHHYHHYHHVCRRFSPDQGLCSNKVIQSTIIILVVVMAFCLLAMATLYFLDWHKRNSIDYVAALADRNKEYEKYAFTRPPPKGSTTENAPGLMALTPNSTSTTTTKRLPGGVPPAVYPCVHLRCPAFCCYDSSYYIELRKGKMESPLSNKIKDIVIVEKHSPIGRNFRRRRYSAIHVDENLREGDAKNLYDVVDFTNSSAAPATTTTTQISLPNISIEILGGVNVSLDESYCMGAGCLDVRRGNFTFYVPVSRFMPLIPLDVKFNVDPNQQVLFCGKDTGELCYGADAAQVEEGSRMVDGVQKRQSNRWELPVGFYYQSAYKFRIGYSTALCSAPKSDAGASFLEYTLWFYRLCR